ncbi:hypothetical protein K2Z84_33045, partial [Candidatus Binatia bacterium]|nr:hypothetical protein [Candidatus Binatia bacterium]
MPDDIRQAPSPSLEEARHGSTTPADGVRDGRTSAPEGTPRGSAPPSEQTPRRRRRWPLAIALLLAAIVTLAVLASRLVRPRIEQAASSALGRPVRIAS